MEYFKNKLKNNYMILKRKGIVLQNDLVIPELRCSNLEYFEAFDIPYADKLAGLCNDIASKERSKTIIVADSKIMALKAVALISAYAEELKEDGEYGWGIEYDDEDYPAAPVINLDFSYYTRHGKNDINFNMLAAACNNYSGDYIVFSGFDNERYFDILVDSVGYCEINNQFVIIHPEQFHLKSIQRLIYDRGYKDIVFIPEMTDEYYMGVFKYLLTGSIYNSAPDVDVNMLYHRLKKKRGEYLCEEDIATLLDEAANEASKENRVSICLNDFGNLISVDKEKSWNRLMNMEGLDNLKSAAREIVAYVKEQQRNTKLKPGHNNMLFSGNPGTGKTTGARLFADVLEEAGCGNGNFVVATRKDLIGEYVGHTAPLVARCFKEARGGILFVDEAGFLTQRGSGGFVDEALKEFVRYMENETDVIVIFAMYPQEAKELLEHDNGLLSRIKRVVNFEDYSVKQLSCIAGKMFEENGYVPDKKCVTKIENYLKTCKHSDKEQFGNARVVRNIVEGCISQVSLRHMDEKSKVDNNVTVQDVENAIKNMKGISSKSNITFGFCNNSGKLCNAYV